MPTFVCEFTDSMSIQYRVIAVDKSKSGRRIFVIEKFSIDALNNPAWSFVKSIISHDEDVMYDLLMAIMHDRLTKTMSV